MGGGPKNSVKWDIYCLGLEYLLSDDYGLLFILYVMPDRNDQISAIWQDY